jgi:hypothetical protein
MAKKATNGTATPVLVTTEHRGVFFGYLAEGDYDEDKRRIKLTKMRNCVYWSNEVHGFIGLATTGPIKGCRVGPPAVRATLHSVTAVIEVEPAATARWEDAPW